MSKLKTNMKAWKEQGAALATELRERLKELDTERGELIQMLQRIGGQPVKPNGAPPHKHRKGKGPGRFHSKLGQSIQNVLQEAGPEGLSSGEVYEALAAEAPGEEVQQDAVLTLLSRMKKRGLIQVEGEMGSSQYIINIP